MPPKLAFSNSEQGGEFGAQGTDRCGGRTGTGCVRRCLVVFSCPSAAEHAGAVMRGAGGQRRARKGEAGRPSRAGLVHCAAHHPELDYQKTRYIAHFVERSHPTFLGRSRPLAVPGRPIWARLLEKEAREYRHIIITVLNLTLGILTDKELFFFPSLV